MKIPTKFYAKQKSYDNATPRVFELCAEISGIRLEFLRCQIL